MPRSALCLLLALGVCAGQEPAFDLARDPAADLARKARDAERSGRIAAAYLLYAQAAAENPKNPKYWQQSQALRAQAIIEANVLPPAGPADLPEEVPGITIGPVSQADLADARRPLPPRRLSGATGTQSFDVKGDAKQLWEKIAAAWKLEAVFDGDYQAGNPFRFRLEDADYRGTLRALSAATSSFVVPVSERVFLVAKDTQPKRAELDPHVAVAVPVPEPFTVQDLQDVVRMVQQAAEIPKFAIDTGRRIIFMRDRVSKVRLAQSLFDDVLRPRAQIVVEVALYDVSRSTSTDYGMSLPGRFPLVFFGSIWGSKPAIPSGFVNFLTFGAGKTFLGFGLTNAQLFAETMRSEGQTLLQTQLRVMDGSPGQIHVGDKYPVMTTGYFGAQAAPGQQVYSPPPTFQFEDLGLVLKVTPRVQKGSEFVLEVESDFKVLTGQSLNGIPVIATRKYQSTVNVPEGEAAVLAGLLSRSEAHSISGIAGLSSLPVLGRLLRTNSHSEERREVLLVMTPHLVSMPPSEIPTRLMYSGTDSRLPDAL